ncbi:phage holin [Fannyhessea vaginae]|jgi:holin, phage phi LC3 family|uniref:phage holin n=1 Tax=Fannyhessea vaginae TaxID=82135 RepID=UPI00204DA868|nr:phage holin [Fannyhessea vaginae]DAM56758.1 MAG TPA: holin [Caudoviricetes sp.]
MINWKIRMQNKTFWLALVPAFLLLIQAVAQVFNVSLDFTNLNKDLLGVVNALFTVLAIVGVVADPTTKGLSDSTQALTYSKPKED